MKNSNEIFDRHIDGDIVASLARVKQRIAAAEQRFDRVPGSVQLLAISKTKPVSMIQEAVGAGQQCFGENYAQEATEKIICLQQSKVPISWHFVGRIQSNKARYIAHHFQWAHTVTRVAVARKLSELRTMQQPLNICLQVNISDDPNKAGVAAGEVGQLVKDCGVLPNIRLRGLMTMPIQESDFGKQRVSFRALRKLFTEIKAEFADLDTLSMGTSHDLEAAIAEGATIVRVGTAVFGARN